MLARAGRSQHSAVTTTLTRWAHVARPEGHRSSRPPRGYARTSRPTRNTAGSTADRSSRVTCRARTAAPVRARSMAAQVVPTAPVCDGSTRPAGKAPPMHAARLEADRQLPLGGESSSTMSATSCAIRMRRAARSRARALPPTPMSIQVNPAPDGSERLTRHRQRDGDALARLHRSAVQDRRHAARPRARDGARAPCRRAPRRLRSGRRGRSASAARRRGLSHAAPGADAAPSRHRWAARNSRLHAGAARAGRDGGGPHPDPQPPQRSDGLAAALAGASQRRARAHPHRDRGRRSAGGGRALRALYRPRSDPRNPRGSAPRSTAAASISSARMPSPGCCRKSRSRRFPSQVPTGSGWHRWRGSDDLFKRAGLPTRRNEQGLVAAFPVELGQGAWLFTE